jgi:hypothetical protein
MTINERSLATVRPISTNDMSRNMADKTTITAPSSARQGNVPIGAEVTAGSTTGKLRVFDTGVDSFPDLSGVGNDLNQGFHALTVSAGITGGQSLDALYQGASTNPVIVPIKAKRSITLLADSANLQTVMVGDKATLAHATPGNRIGFPLAPGASITLEIVHGSQIYLDCVTADCVVYWIAV